MTGNIITGNVGNISAGAGIGAVGGSPRIHDNYIAGNETAATGGGIFAANGQAEITMNAIENNTAGGAAGCGRVRREPGRPRELHLEERCRLPPRRRPVHQGARGQFTNNVVLETQQPPPAVGCTCPARRAGRTSSTTPSPSTEGHRAQGVAIHAGGTVLANNIVAGSAAQPPVWCAPGLVPAPEFSYNDVFNGAPSPYQRCADPAGTSGNLSVDPLLNEGLKYVPTPARS